MFFSLILTFCYLIVSLNCRNWSPNYSVLVCFVYLIPGKPERQGVIIRHLLRYPGKNPNWFPPSPLSFESDPNLMLMAAAAAGGNASIGSRSSLMRSPNSLSATSELRSKPMEGSERLRPHPENDGTIIKKKKLQVQKFKRVYDIEICISKTENASECQKTSGISVSFRVFVTV
jgi:hypothetical protein